jgi:hypothetical protein
MIAGGGFEPETMKGTHAMLQLYLAMVQLAAAIWLAVAQANALIGEKASARKAAERAIMLLPSAKDALERSGLEEYLALVQTILGENGRAISTLAHLLQTPYSSNAGRTPITPALLRLDPFWDPLRSDSAFQKLCDEKQP